jgi:hypothetical protein
MPERKGSSGGRCDVLQSPTGAEVKVPRQAGSLAVIYLIGTSTRYESVKRSPANTVRLHELAK